MLLSLSRCCRLRFRKVVDKVIPYLPMDATSNALVVELKLQHLEKTLPGKLYTTQGGFGRSIGC